MYVKTMEMHSRLYNQEKLLHMWPKDMNKNMIAKGKGGQGWEGLGVWD